MATVWRSQCAFARLFAGKSAQYLNNATDLGVKRIPELLPILTSRNYSSYAKSPLIYKIKEQNKFVVRKKPPEWEYVQRLLPFEEIPQVKPKDEYPSGWIPPKEESKNLPFFISRTKNQELPIYLELAYRGTRKTSKIKNIEGDIWLLNDEIKGYLKNKHGKYIETQVNELTRFIRVKGDYVTDLCNWAYSKGF